MKIKASLVMPALAAVTVVAIVATGIALGQLRSGAPWVTLLSSMPRLEAAARADALAVADSDALAAEGGQLQPPILQLIRSSQLVRAGLNRAAVAPRQEASTVAPDSGVSMDSRDSNVVDRGSDPETPSDGPLPAEDSPSRGVGDGDQLQVTVVDPSKNDPNVEEAAAQVAAADSDQESKSAAGQLEDDHYETAPGAGAGQVSLQTRSLRMLPPTRRRDR